MWIKKLFDKLLEIFFKKIKDKTKEFIKEKIEEREAKNKRNWFRLFQK